ncbi:MAG TPA: chemotaxis protein CheB [Acetobacteraceae bacterium]
MDNGKHFVVAVGASGADGLQDMCNFLSELPKKLSATILCTLHRPPDKQSSLAEVLQRASTLEIIIPSHGESLRPGCCYIGLPDRHLTLTTLRRACLVPHRKEHRGKTVDLLFDSIAAHAADSGLGVVLAGSLSDGSRGLRAIKLAGGAVFARPTRNSAVMDMPAHAIAEGAPLHLIGAVPDLAREIVRRCGVAQRRSVQQPASTCPHELIKSANPAPRADDAELKPTLTLPILPERTKSLQA